MPNLFKILEIQGTSIIYNIHKNYMPYLYTTGLRKRIVSSIRSIYSHILLFIDLNLETHLRNFLIKIYAPNNSLETLVPQLKIISKENFTATIFT